MNRLQLVKFFQKVSNTNFIGTAKGVRYLAYLLLGNPKGKIKVETVDGFSIIVEPSFDKKGLEHDLYYLGTYEKGTIQVMKNYLTPNDNFIDVGANIGFVSLAASKMCVNGKVFSYEANPDTFKILKENIALNKVQNIEVFDFALGAENTTAQIFPNTLKNNRGGASMVKNELNANDNGLNVLVKKLDELPILSNKIAMMKIDVEGFEMEVMKGAQHLLTSGNAPALIVECSESRSNFNFTPIDLYRFIVNVNQYRIFKLLKGKERISKLIEVKGEKDLPFHDNLFCFLPDQIAKLNSNLF